MDIALDDGSGGTTTEGIFQRSLEEFKANLTEAQRESFPEYTIRHVKLKILDIQRYQERVKSMMNFPRIKSFLDRFGDIDALCCQERVAGNVSGEVSGFIWGATSYILQVAQEDNAILSIVLDAYQAFGKRIPVIQPHVELIQAHPNEMRCLAYIYQDLLRLYTKMIKLLTGRGWKKTFNVDWADYKNQFDTILTSLDDHGSILTDLSRAWQSQRHDNYMNGHVMSWSGACRQLMLRYDQKRDQKLREAKEAEEKRREEHTNEVLQWLRPSSGLDQESRHKKYRKVREEFPDTSHWILRENKMDNWINEEIPPQSIMWLHGKKGAGKTILASTIIDGCAATPEFTTTYFYCREDDPGLNTAAAALKDILRQLLVHNQGPLPSCRNKKVHGGEEVLTNIDTIKSLLELFCESDMKQFVVIDGLDECPMPEVKAIVKFWTTVVDKCDEYKPGKLRVLFLSHENDDIRKLMQKAVIFDLTPDQSADDIEKYLEAQFKKLQQMWASEGFHLGDGETQAAKQTVLRLCQGSFLYAHLTMGHLFWQQNIQAVRGEMRERMLPSDLGKAYEKTINRLEKDFGPNDMRWHMAKKVFSLLAGAARPLKWHELQAALLIESRGVTATYQELEDNIELICGGLVQRLENRVEFIHSTTKWNVLRSRHLSRERVYCDMAVLCLKYLSSGQFQHELDEQQVERAVIGGYYSFQDYAVSKWNTHLEMLISHPFGNFFITHGQEEMSLSGALAEFLMFHRESIKLAEEKKQPVGKESHLSPRSSQNQVRQSRSPRSSRQSLSSRSPTPSQPGWQEQEEIDPAEACKPFLGRTFYSNLVGVWAHILNHRKAGWKERYKVSLPNLDTALENARRKIESLADRYKTNRDEASMEHLVKLYGERYFKCQRITCDFFHEGFETKSELDSHSNRHDRPYHCPVESCGLQPFGFSTNKDKDKHIRNYHPELSDDPAYFKIGTANGKQATAEAKYKCTICSKSFTRQSILKEHTDAHYGERKHACETCGKRFTRANDRNRHRKIHVRRARGA